MLATSDAPRAGLHVTWTNVLVAFSLLLLDILLSSYFQLGLTKDLIIAAGRCVLQLSLLGFVLQAVFAANNPFAVAAVGSAMLLLGANEVTFARSKRRTQGLFFTTALSLGISVAPVAILGAKFALINDPFWSPQSMIPVIGMLAGSAIGGAAVAVNLITKEIVENRDKLETYLAHGASRHEACLPLICEALKVALLPTVNQMSVVGLISIPGMMTGAILGGAAVDVAARMQMIIMFLITACTTLCVLSSSFLVTRVLVDDHHRIRLDRIAKGPLWPTILYQAIKKLAAQAMGRVAAAWTARRTSGYARLNVQE